MFKYFEESAAVEKKEIGKRLLTMYNDANENYTDCYEAYHQNKTAENKQSYFESSQRLSTILDIFEILHFDYGKSLDD